MAQVATQPYSESQRMQIKRWSALPAEHCVYWPMRTFVHHNPLHGLEHLTFAAAVEKAQQSLGGTGYLSNNSFAITFASGAFSASSRRDPETRALPERIKLGAREITHLEVLRACMLCDIPSQQMTGSTPNSLAIRIDT